MTRFVTASINGWKMQSTQIIPKKLNMKWANAALRACALPVRAAILEVTVVPMFSPITSAIPRYRSNTPLEHNINVIAITAADDCTAIVIMPPISRNNSTENIPHSLQDAIKDRSTWLCSRSMCIAFSRKVVSPKNIKANPKTNSPNDLRPLFLENIKGRDNANRG